MAVAVNQNRFGFHDFNSTLICSIALLVLSSFNYGISDQVFAATQATNAFAKQFGDFDVKSKTYTLPVLYLSLLNSLKSGTQIFGESHCI
jgi:SP family sugar:H+ symporter-like MFS transporter